MENLKPFTWKEYVENIEGGSSGYFYFEDDDGVLVKKREVLYIFKTPAGKVGYISYSLKTIYNPEKMWLEK